MQWSMERYHEVLTYQWEPLHDAGLIQAFSNKASGNMALHTGDDPKAVIQRREQWMTALGLSLSQLVVADQVHGTRVQVVDRKMAGNGANTLKTAIPRTDALITRERGVVLAVLTADCLPILLYDAVTPAVAAIHAGWRGSLDRIVERVVEKMVRSFHTAPENLWAGIGPAIGPCCFQVDRELAERFAQADPTAVTERQGIWLVNLPGFNIGLLRRAGVKTEKISPSEICTVCHSDAFFSYRATQGTSGRMMGIIGLK